MSNTNEKTVERPATPCKHEAAEKHNAYLTILKGTSVGRTYRLGTGRLIVGRAADCDIVLDDDGVSRRHALFVVSVQGKVTIEDLRSTNGTLINGQCCDVSALHGGERLQFGSDTVFKFEFRDPIEEALAPDLLMVLLPGIDRVSHVLWGTLEAEDRYPEHLRPRPPSARLASRRCGSTTSTPTP